MIHLTSCYSAPRHPIPSTPASLPVLGSARFSFSFFSLKHSLPRYTCVLLPVFDQQQPSHWDLKFQLLTFPLGFFHSTYYSQTYCIFTYLPILCPFPLQNIKLKKVFFHTNISSQLRTGPGTQLELIKYSCSINYIYVPNTLVMNEFFQLMTD